MNWNISLDPLSSGCASPSARPSVIDLCNVTFTPVAASRQPLTRIGFPSGLCVATHKTLEFQCRRDVVSATESGFVPKAVNLPDARFFRQLATYGARLCESSAEILNRNFISARLFHPQQHAATAAGLERARLLFLIPFGIDEVTRS